MNTDFQHYLNSQSRFQSYLYSYPHKTAYRPLAQPVDLRRLWQNEKKQALYLYSHIPFCNMKCAFCNLFTLSHPAAEQVQRYLNQLQRQAEVTADNLGEFNIAAYAIGGGTPSILSPAQLTQLFDIYQRILRVDLERTPGSFEISPDTITKDKLTLLRQHQVQRISIGIQSFVASEAKAVGRQQPNASLRQVLEQIRQQDFAIFNLDLIYGIPGQTAETWLYSLQQAMLYKPNEVFLYPLYIRPLTGLFNKNRPSDIRDQLYTLGRDFLLSQGYLQDSMRLFKRPELNLTPSNEYSCQEDGMIGLGTNARSYTRQLHYSSEYAVGKPQVAAIIEHYLQQSTDDFTQARYGIELDLDERKRRYLIKSLLKAAGLNCVAYQQQFASDVFADFPELTQLPELALATYNEQQLQLTAAGMAHSDVLGHWFISPAVQQKMQQYILK